jgi:hypothetical protein
MNDSVPAGIFPTTTLEGTLMIMLEINRIQFERKALEWFQRQAPGVVKELQRQGVRFPDSRG